MITMESKEEKTPLLGNSGDALNKDYASKNGKTLSDPDITIKEVHLEKHIGLGHAVGIIVGNVIGSGIFLSPKGVVENVGSVGATLILWGATGIYALAQALCYAELGTIIPKAGGDYAYIYMILGPLPGFLCVWSQVMAIGTSANGAISQTAGTYIADPIGISCYSYYVTMIAILLLLSFMTLNILSVKWSVRVQSLLSTGKVIALGAIIIIGLVKIGEGNTKNFENPFEGTVSDPSKIALAALDGYFAYKGWELVNTLPEEMVNPKRDLPRAVWIAMLLVTTIYVMTNVAYFSVLSPAEVIASEAVALDFADRTLGSVGWIVSIFVAMSCMGTVNGSFLSDSRYLFAGGRTRQLPQFFGMIHIDYLTPMTSVIFICIISIIYSTIPNAQQLAEYTALVVQLKIMLALVALFYLRWKEPNIERPVKVNIIVAILVFIVLIALIGLSVYSNPVTTGMGIGLFVIGIPVHYLGKLCSRSLAVIRFMDSVTVFAQKLFHIVPEASGGQLESFKFTKKDS